MRALLVTTLLVAASAHGEEFYGAVARVVDGDSLMVNFHGQQVRVRLKVSRRDRACRIGSAALRDVQR